MGSIGTPPAAAEKLTCALQALVVGRVRLEQLNLTASGLSWRPGSPPVMEVGGASIQAVLAEPALNCLLAEVQEGAVTHLQAQLHSGRLRITGRYGWVPFELIAEPVVVSGTCLGLDVVEANVVGFPIPGYGLDRVAALVNARVGQATNVGRLFPEARITGVKADPGRLTITLEASSLAIRLGGPPSGPPQTLPSAG
ncbi:MAG: hypothetical protein ACP5VE_10435 [Chthonomonadales bacterium]